MVLIVIMLMIMTMMMTLSRPRQTTDDDSLDHQHHPHHHHGMRRCGTVLTDPAMRQKLNGSWSQNKTKHTDIIRNVAFLGSANSAYDALAEKEKGEEEAGEVAENREGEVDRREEREGKEVQKKTRNTEKMHPAP